MFRNTSHYLWKNVLFLYRSIELSSNMRLKSHPRLTMIHLACYKNLNTVNTLLKDASHFVMIIIRKHHYIVIIGKFVGPYDFCNVENTDRLAESSHKNGIYCITRNVTEFAKFWMNKSKVSQYISNKSRYGLVSVNINSQKDYLNPACSACLIVNE